MDPSTCPSSLCLCLENGAGPGLRGPTGEGSSAGEAAAGAEGGAQEGAEPGGAGRGHAPGPRRLPLPAPHGLGPQQPPPHPQRLLLLTRLPVRAGDGLEEPAGGGPPTPHRPAPRCPGLRPLTGRRVCSDRPADPPQPPVPTNQPHSRNQTHIPPP